LRFGSLLSLQRLPAALCGPDCRSRTIPLRRFPASAPTPLADIALAVFSASRLFSFVTLLRRRPRGSFMGDFFHPRTGHAGQLSRPGRDFTPGDAPGIHIPFAVLLRPANEIIFRHLEPTCRFAWRPPRVSSSRSTPYGMPMGVWPRLLGSRPRISRAVFFAGPAMACMHRVARTHQPGLPWVLFPLSGFRRRPPVSTSGAFPPVGF
jgi:hypothetical protein